MPDDKTKAAGKEAHDLAKEAKADQEVEGSDVALASQGREAAMDRADDMAEDAGDAVGRQSVARREQHRELTSKAYTALHPWVRNGKPVYPGEALKFTEDEGEHILDALASGSLVEGAPGDKAVKEALGRADLARGRALAQ